MSWVIYSGNWLLWSTSNTSFGLLQIEREPMIVKKTNDTSFESPDNGHINSKRKMDGIIRGLPRPLFVKSVLFKKKGRGNLLRLPRPCPPGILLSIIWALKWGIVGLCNICTFWVNWAQIRSLGNSSILLNKIYENLKFPNLSSIYSKSTSYTKTHNTSF